MPQFATGTRRRAAFTAAVTLSLALLPRLALAQDRVPDPLPLESAITIALERSPRLASARAAVAVARADTLDATLRPNPALSIESSSYPLFGSPHPSFWNGQEFSLRVDQEFETGGRRRLRTDAANMRVQAAEATLANSQRLLAFEVRRAYLEVVLAVADLDAANRSLAEVDQLIALNRARLEQGEISGVEVRRVQVERLRFSDDASAAELGVRRARSALLALLAYQDLSQRFDAATPLTSPSASVASPSPLAQVGLDIPALQIRALEARHDVRSARADAEQQVAASERAIVETIVRLEIQQAADAADIARARVTAIERDYLPSARQALDTVLASYRVGAANLIDLLDAQRAFRDTQRTFNRALFAWHLSIAELTAAIGEPLSGR